MAKQDVLIVGVGPTGLMMACQLALRNIPFRIIDKNEDHTTQSRALVIHARTLEIFEQMGIAQEAIALGRIAKGVNMFVNGKRRLRLNFTNIGEGLSQFPFLLILEQSKTEKLLTDLLNRLGHDVERNTELLDFNQKGTSVTATIKQRDKDSETLETHWLIGSDGASSLVRKQLHIPFAGKTYNESLFVLDCEITMDIPQDEMCICFSDKTFSGLFPMTNGRFRVIGIVPDDLENKETLSFEDISKDFASRSRLDIALKNPKWMSKYHSHHRAVGNFRQGQCFLTGDAAHVHSPVGAQGMNTGLQDAYNLAWKLALVIKKQAKEDLLDTYNEERIVIAHNLVKTTDRVFHLVTSKNKVFLLFRMYFIPTFMRLILPIAQHIRFIRETGFKGISEIALNYRYSSLSKDNESYSFFNSVPKAGDRMTYFPEIQALLSGIHFHLIIFSGTETDKNNDKIQHFKDNYKGLISLHDIPFNEKTKTIYKALGIQKQGYYFIRPDNYIACKNGVLALEEVIRYLKKHIIEN